MSQLLGSEPRQHSSEGSGARSAPPADDARPSVGAILSLSPRIFRTPICSWFRDVPSATFSREDSMPDRVSNVRESYQKADNIYRHNSRRWRQGCPGPCDLADQAVKANKLRAGFQAAEQAWSRRSPMPRDRYQLAVSSVRPRCVSVTMLKPDSPTIPKVSEAMSCGTGTGPLSVERNGTGWC